MSRKLQPSRSNLMGLPSQPITPPEEPKPMRVVIDYKNARCDVGLPHEFFFRMPDHAFSLYKNGEVINVESVQDGMAKGQGVVCHLPSGCFVKLLPDTIVEMEELHKEPVPLQEPPRMPVWTDLHKRNFSNESRPEQDEKSRGDVRPSQGSEASAKAVCLGEEGRTEGCGEE